MERVLGEAHVIELCTKLRVIDVEGERKLNHQYKY